MLKLPTIKSASARSSSAGRTDYDFLESNTAFVMKNNLSIKEANRKKWEVSRNQRLREEEFARAERSAADNINRILSHHRDSSRKSNRSSSRCAVQISRISDDIDRTMDGANEYRRQKQHLDDLCSTLYASSGKRADFSFASAAASYSTKSSNDNKSERANSRQKYTI